MPWKLRAGGCRYAHHWHEYCNEQVIPGTDFCGEHTTPPAPARAEEVEPVLPCDVIVGNATFRKGVKVSTMQGAIIRQRKYLDDRAEALERRVGELEAEVKRLETALDHAVPDGRDMI